MITHPEKVLFPDDGIAKGDLAAYYETIAPVLLPHMIRRPVRAKNGAPVSAPCTWEEVERGDVTPRTFTLRNLPEGVEMPVTRLAPSDLQNRGRHAIAPTQVERRCLIMLV